MKTNVEILLKLTFHLIAVFFLCNISVLSRSPFSTASSTFFFDTNWFQPLEHSQPFAFPLPSELSRSCPNSRTRSWRIAPSWTSCTTRSACSIRRRRSPRRSSAATSRCARSSRAFWTSSRWDCSSVSVNVIVMGIKRVFLNLWNRIHILAAHSVHQHLHHFIPSFYPHSLFHPSALPQAELVSVLYPLLVHSVLELVKRGFPHEGWFLFRNKIIIESAQANIFFGVVNSFLIPCLSLVFMQWFFTQRRKCCRVIDTNITRCTRWTWTVWPRSLWWSICTPTRPLCFISRIAWISRYWIWICHAWKNLKNACERTKYLHTKWTLEVYGHRYASEEHKCTREQNFDFRLVFLCNGARGSWLEFASQIYDSLINKKKTETNVF